jgi:DNA repair protein RadA/Sms
MTEEVVVASTTDATSPVLGRALRTSDVTGRLITPVVRISTSIGDIDGVLGGGIVSGSVILIAGQPGIGKSTLLMQLASSVAAASTVLYVSGEESAGQVGMRAKRLKAAGSKLKLATSTSADDVAASVRGGDYSLVIVDSIQTMTCSGLNSASGTISQISGSTQLIMAAAKASNTAVIIVGHVTKEGMIAGPKVLEHIVDVVLQLEGDSYGGFKLLRSTKNRYGSTNEVAILEMTDNGLKPVSNPSAALLAERQSSDGSIVLATMEGARPLLVEVQALVNPTNYGYPKRAASGIDLNRVNLLIAMLERRTKLNLANQDVYINIVGGIRVSEPAADLAIAMSIASAAKGYQLRENAVVFGEVGLSGEVRHVPYTDKRINEAKKLGFDLAIGPVDRSAHPPALLDGVRDVRMALNKYLTKK